jgi:hypothetical protein
LRDVLQDSLTQTSVAKWKARFLEGGAREGMLRAAPKAHDQLSSSPWESEE